MDSASHLMRIGKWSLASLQQRLVKTGGRLIQHARSTTGCCWPRASDAAVVCRYAAEDRGAAVPGRIRGAQSRADFGDDAEAQLVVCEDLVGEAAVSGILCQREAELARCGWVESPFDSKQRSNFAFAQLPVSVRV